MIDLLDIRHLRLITAADEAAGRQPRQIPNMPSSFCTCGSRPDIAEYRN